MGFMDKAKKLAEQAQEKLDDVQQQFNDKQGSNPSPSGPAVEYDEHGRAVPRDEETPQGDPLAPRPAAAGSPDDDRLRPAPQDGETPQGDPLRDAAPAPAPTPPSGGGGLTSGDPLAG